MSSRCNPKGLSCHCIRNSWAACNPNRPGCIPPNGTDLLSCPLPAAELLQVATSLRAGCAMTDTGLQCCCCGSAVHGHGWRAVAISMSHTPPQQWGPNESPRQLQNILRCCTAVTARTLPPRNIVDWEPATTAPPVQTSLQGPSPVHSSSSMIARGHRSMVLPPKPPVPRSTQPSCSYSLAGR